MSITSILNIARNALFAQQTALQVLSNNVANVNTKGYARQEALLEEAVPLRTQQGLVGNGVRVTDVIRYYDKYLEFSIARQNNAMEEHKTYERYFERIEGILDDNNSRLTSNIVDFFNGWHELTTDPLSVTARTNVSIKGANLGRAIRSMYSELQGIRVEIDNNIAKEVAEVNSLLSGIAELNKKMYEGSASGSEDASFASKRTELFRQLSAKLDVQVMEDANGGMTIMTNGGKLLVERGNVYELAAEKLPDFYFGELNSITWGKNAGYSVVVTDTIGSGTLKGLLELRDTHLVDFMKNLDDLAESIINEVNSIHASGYNMNGTTNVNFFRSVSDNYALNMDISDEIKADVKHVAVTNSPGNPSDNGVALLIASLGQENVTIGGRLSNYVGYSASLASEIGNLTRNAKDLSDYHQNLMSMVEKQRESVSGVSLDEEMSNLVKFQYAYQAAARLINVADEMFRSILEVGR